ncbi:MAG: DUF4405 domain-containing protein [Planctomycetaceae bacterium]|nr:DUF4405 domain-containing protein [Planctomycetaceae bacterium]
MSPTETETQALPESDRQTRTPADQARGSWMSRTLLNFWVDFSLLVLFLALLWVEVVLYFLFPPGPAGEAMTLWGLSVEHWRGFQFGVICLFALDVLLHVMLHWSWVCSVVAKHVLHRKPTRDDGIQTIIGVGVLIAIIHILAAALLAAWFGIAR